MSLRQIVRTLRASVVVAAAVWMASSASAHDQGGTVVHDDRRVHDDREFQGRRAWVVENGRLEVTLLRGGGHIAAIRLLTGDLPTGNLGTSISPLYVPATDRGYVGHLVCFPSFGPPSPDERQAGLTGHGEAQTVEWREMAPPTVSSDGVTFSYGAELPKTQYRIARTITLRTGEAVIDVAETIENLVDYDRPYNWNQHATFGAPFVTPGRLFLDMSAGAGVTDRERTANGQWIGDREIVWPSASRADGATISLREFHASPGGQAGGQVYTAFRASGETAWFTLFNPDQRLLVGYVFAAADHPWIIDWQNRPRADSPAGTARGIEFGTSPFDEGLRRSVERGQLLGTPSYRWIGGRGRASTRYTIFLTEVASTFAGVEAVDVSPGGLGLRERGTGRSVTIERKPAR